MSDAISIKLEGIDRAMRKFSPKIVRSAARETINRTVVHGRSTASKLITSEYNVKAREVNAYLIIESRAKDSKLEAIIRGRGKGLALSKFDARSVGRSSLVRNGKGSQRSITGVMIKGDVTVKVKKGGPRRVVSSRYGNRPFVAQMKSGHVGVWVRKGKERKPIEQLYGPGVGGLFGSKRIMNGTIKAINDRFSPEFKRQLVFYLSRVK